MNKNKCDTVGCDNEAEWYDELDNQICTDCMMQDIEETGNSAEDYEDIRILKNNQRIKQNMRTKRENRFLKVFLIALAISIIILMWKAI